MKNTLSLAGMCVELGPLTISFEKLSITMDCTTEEMLSYLAKVEEALNTVLDPKPEPEQVTKPEQVARPERSLAEISRQHRREFLRAYWSKEDQKPEPEQVARPERNLASVLSRQHRREFLRAYWSKEDQKPEKP